MLNNTDITCSCKSHWRYYFFNCYNEPSCDTCKKPLIININRRNELKNLIIMNKKEINLKDLVPEGFELDKNHLAQLDTEKGILSIPFIKKEEKTFESYIENYVLSECPCSPEMEEETLKYLTDHKFDLVSFEYKIGLFKSICIRKKWDFIKELTIVLDTLDWPVLDMIFPKEFIESLVSDINQNV